VTYEERAAALLTAIGLCDYTRSPAHIAIIIEAFEQVEQETDRRWQEALHPMMVAKVKEMFSGDEQKANDARPR
jgi:hypothetical protein